ncbi:MAG: hypothetical protein Q4G09_04125 [Clostridia bacterium]|nr:hypothetical protein [Clostridia bacterium]
MGRKNKRKKINKTKQLSIYGKLIRPNKIVAFCKLHSCYLEPKDIAEKKCNKKGCRYKVEIIGVKNGKKSIAI